MPSEITQHHRKMAEYESAKARAHQVADVFDEEDPVISAMVLRLAAQLVLERLPNHQTPRDRAMAGDYNTRKRRSERMRLSAKTRKTRAR